MRGVSQLTSLPRLGSCRDCTRPILTGHAEGLPYAVTPVPVTIHGEVECRQAGRHSYQLAYGRLLLRDRSRVLGSGSPVVFVDHTCDEPRHISGEHAAQALALVRDSGALTLLGDILGAIEPDF